MIDKKKIMIKYFSVLILAILFISGCMSLKSYEKKGLNIYIQQKEPNYKRKSLMVFNFKEPDYAQGKGKLAGLIFHKNLLSSNKFYLVGLNNNSTWDQYGKTEEKQLKAAIDEGRAQKVDFIFVGEIVDYVFGGLNKTRVTVKVRVIEVKTGITFFMCEYGKTNLGKDISNPLSTKMTDSSDFPSKVLDDIAKKIILKL